MEPPQPLDIETPFEHIMEAMNHNARAPFQPFDMIDSLSRPYSMHIGSCGILESGITTHVQAHDPSKPLPRALTPGQILQTMVDIGNEHCMSTVTTMLNCDLSACRVTQKVHWVASSTPVTVTLHLLVMTHHPIFSSSFLPCKAVSATIASHQITSFACAPQPLMKTRNASPRPLTLFGPAQKRKPAISKH
jgi:hypothetical protein